MHRQHRRDRRFGRRRIDGRLHAFIGQQSFQKGRGLRRSIGGSIGFHAADEIADHFDPVDQVRPQHVRSDQRIGQIDGSTGCRRPDQEFDEADGAGIALQQIPVPIDRDGRKRFCWAR